MDFKNPLSRNGKIRLACLLASVLGAGCSDAVPGPTSTTFDVQRYALRGEYDWDRSRLVATLDVTVSPTENGMTEIAFDSAVTEVKAVRLAGGRALPFSVDKDAEVLRVDVSDVHPFEKAAVFTFEIDYEAEPSDSLLAVGTRKGDPIDVRTLFTQSEPLGAKLWMPCHDIPRDRALFSVDLRIPDKEKMISNGVLVSDTPGGDGTHRVKYETAYPLPTYLMAFAVGDFEEETAMKDKLPVSIWHRRGLQGNYQAVLGETVGMIKHFEELLGPYPFERYAIVQLPTLPATGEENAGITFQYEGTATQPLGLDLGLIAHELGHQWFGDLVTIEDWQDLWIKEGMASLLEVEGVRLHTDKDGPFTLNGDNYYVESGVPIHDPSLEPDRAYTSGAYGRAAWYLTQLRGNMGEDEFWSTLRQVLKTRRFDFTNTSKFLEVFSTRLDPYNPLRASLWLTQAVDARSLPTLTVKSLPSGGATVTLNDPDKALFSAFEVGWVKPDGSMRKQQLEIGKPTDLVPQGSDEFLVLDPMDIHPTWDSFIADDESSAAYEQSVLPLLVPTTAAAQASFLDIGSAAQEPVISSTLPGVTPEGFTSFVAGLDSEWTQAMALSTACTMASDPSLDPQTAAAWKSVLDDALTTPPATFTLDMIQVYGYADCTMFDAEAAFASDWEKLKTGLPAGEVDYPRLSFLSAFPIPAPLAMSTWGSVATQAGVAKMRWLATMKLRSYLKTLDPADVPAWRKFFVDMLSQTEDTDVLIQVIRAVVATKGATAAENKDALAGLGVMLHSRYTRHDHLLAICSAYKLTAGDAAAWASFAAGLSDAPLQADSVAMLRDPSQCP